MLLIIMIFSITIADCQPMILKELRGEETVKINLPFRPIDMRALAEETFGGFHSSTPRNSTLWVGLGLRSNKFNKAKKNVAAKPKHKSIWAEQNMI